MRAWKDAKIRLTETKAYASELSVVVDAVGKALSGNATAVSLQNGTYRICLANQKTVEFQTSAWPSWEHIQARLDAVDVAQSELTITEQQKVEFGL